VEGEDAKRGQRRQAVRGGVTQREVKVEPCRYGDEDETLGNRHGKFQPERHHEHRHALADDGQPAQADQRVELETVAWIGPSYIIHHSAYMRVREPMAKSYLDRGLLR